MKTKVLNLLFLLSALWSYGQSCGALMTPLSIENRASESTTIVEGVVTSSQSYWDVNQYNIYTVHTVNIYTNMLNNNATAVQVVTMGGRVGDEMQVTSGEAVLNQGDTGAFFLKAFTGQLNIPSQLYEMVGAGQGIIKYDKYSNKAFDVFNQYPSVEDDVYSRIRNVTRQSFQVLQARPRPNTAHRSSAAAPSTTGFSPSSVSAGTGTQLTITGSNFGTTMGTVKFPDANAGGALTFDTLASQIISWSDTQIILEVPNPAGTGNFAISTSDGQLGVSPSPLNITFNHSHIGNATAAYPLMLQDDDGNGGYAFQYHTDFDTSAAKPVFEDAFELWNCESNINFSFGTVSTVDASVNDGINIVRFDNGNEIPSGTLGRVTTRAGICAATGNALVTEMDVTWNDGPNWYYGSGTPGSTQHDFKSVALHELGHAHQLGHVIDFNTVMHYSIGPGQTTYNLNQDNVDGALYTMGLFTSQSPGCSFGATTPQYNCCDDIEILDETFQGNVAENGNVNLDFEAENYDSIQWQVSTDNGTSWADLSDAGNYQGVDSTSLNISNVPASFNGNVYRAVLNNLCDNPIMTSEVTLNIVAYTAIPDSNFEAELVAYDDIPGDNQVPTNNINTITSLEVNYAGIQNMTGIDAFAALEVLKASGNPFTSLDLDANTQLVELELVASEITAIDLQLNTSLEILDLEGVELSSLDLQFNTALRILDMDEASIGALNLSANTALESIILDSTGISELIFGTNNYPALTSLIVARCNLTALDVSTLGSLEELRVHDNDLESLNIKNGNNTAITTFRAEDNPNLYCVLVDDENYSTTNWTNVDAQTVFSDASCGYTAIPDAAFEARLGVLGLDDIANDGQVPTWLIDSVTTLDVENSGIADLTGIEGFTALVTLNCSRNSLTVLDMEGNAFLEDLNCNNNLLTSIDVESNQALRILTCERNSLSSLNVLNNGNLEVLDIERNNDIQTIDLSGNPLLRSLSVKFINGFNQLDVSANPNLEILLCNNTNIPSLNLSSNNLLTNVQAHINNSLTSINLNGAVNLEQVLVNNTQVNSLNLRNGNNTAITSFNATNTPSLSCIVVDDVAYSTANWTNVDAGTTFSSTFCAYTAIPDANFEARLDALGYDDIANDGQVPTANINSVTNLDLSNQGISNLTGIQDFTYLEDLNIRDNSLTSVNFSDNELLIDLAAQDNNISSIVLNNNENLAVVNLEGNVITSLDLSGSPNLTIVGVNDNNLTSLNIKNGNNTNITSFSATGNPNLACILVDDIAFAEANLTNIDTQSFFSETNCNFSYTAIPDPAFEAVLSQYDNFPNDGQIPTPRIQTVTEIVATNAGITDVAGLQDFIALEILNLSDNAIDSLNVANAPNLRLLLLDNSNISSITITNNPNLTSLHLGNNSLQSIDLSNNLLLQELYLDNNQMGSLDLSSHTALMYLSLNNNSLINLNVKNGNNTGLNLFNVLNNPSLTCVLVDDAGYAQTNFTNVDAQVTFSDVSCVQYTAIPDANFEAALSVYDDIANDGQVPTANIEVITTLNLENLSATNHIQDVTGIAAFTALEELNIEAQSIENLDVSSNSNLKRLYCASNGMSSLNIQGLLQLEELDMSSNGLSSVDISTNTGLLKLDIADNVFVSLDVSALGQLTELDCRFNQLTTLNVKNGNNTNFTSFNATNNPDLTCIFVDDAAYSTTNWTNIDPTTTFIDGDYCEYTLIPDANFEARLNVLGLDDIPNDGQVPTELIASVTTLFAFNKGISDLTGIEDFAALQSLRVDRNNLQHLDVSNNHSLRTLFVFRNNLETLVLGDINLENLRADENQLTVLDFSQNTALSIVNLRDNQLTSFNIKNGNNTNFTFFDARLNPNLTCVLVDDAAYSTTNWTNIDAQTSFSDTYCRYTAIPDANFEAALSAYDDIANDNRVPTANIEIIQFLDIGYAGISDITGIESFTAMKNIYAEENTISDADFSNNLNLEEINLRLNPIQNLDIASNTQLTSLGLEGSLLSTLSLGNNTNLQYLRIINSPLMEMDLSSNSNLRGVILNDNDLTYLNFKNGNNAIIGNDPGDFYLLNNPNLSCILVDDAAYSTANWTFIDPTASFTDTDYCRYTLIPDPVFEAALDNLGYDDISGDGQVPTALIETVTSLDVQDQFPVKIQDLTGIEDFAALEILNVSYNEIDNLDLSSNTNLITLISESTGLLSLNVAGLDNLEEINCSLNSFMNTLTLQNNTALKKLNCEDTLIPVLNLSVLPALEDLNCSYNPALIALNVKNGNNTNFTIFNAIGTANLTCIAVDDATYSTANWINVEATATFTDGYCRYTAIPDANFESYLEAEGYDDIAGDGQVPTALIENVIELIFAGTGVSDLTGIQDFTALEFFEMGSETISSIDLSANTKIKVIDFDDCVINNLILNNNPLLEILEFDDSDLSSISNLDLSSSPLLRRLDLSNLELVDLMMPAALPNLEILNLLGNNISSFDASLYPSLQSILFSNNPNLTQLNLKNGNNTNIVSAFFINCPNLTCILVDDANYSTTNWTTIDAQTSFSDTYCRYTAIPDAAFEHSLGNLGYDDIPNDGQVPTSLIESVTSLAIFGTGAQNLTGIEDFVALTSLDVGYSSLTNLDVSNNNLITLIANESAIDTLNLGTNTNYETIILNGNQLTEFQFPNLSNLKTLILAGNPITSLDLSTYTALESFNCSDANLSTLNIKNGNNTAITNFQVTNNPNLTCIAVDDATYSTTNWTNVDTTVTFTDAYCRYTAIPDVVFEAALENLGYDDISGDGQVPTALIETITSLDVQDQFPNRIEDLTGIEDFTALEILDVTANNISDLDLSANTNLITLRCEANDLESLNLSGLTQLEELFCDNNYELSSLNLATNTNLRRIDCNDLAIESLDLSTLSLLTDLDCGTNSFLTSLNVKNGNNINFTNFNAAGTNLNCILVDDATYSATNWTNIDAQTSFSDTYCRYTAIPDAAFETALENQGYDDISGDGQVPTALIEVITNLDISSQSPQIEDLTGIVDFTALQVLDIRGNTIDNLDLSANTNLVSILCTSSGLQSLNLTGLTQLEELYCDSNQYSSLDLSTNIGLKILNCSDTGTLTQLDLSNNSALTDMGCAFNPGLTFLNIKNGNNTNITNFSTVGTNNLNCILVDDATYSTTNWTNTASNNSFSDTYCRYTAIPDANFESRLEALGYDDISGDGQVPTALIEVVTSLDVSGNSIANLTGIEDFAALEILNASNNALMSIDVSYNELLEELNVNNNGVLTDIVFGNNLALKKLFARFNALTDIDLSLFTAVEDVFLDNNQLVNLNIKNGNNNLIFGFDTTNNTNLTCILVDDATYSTTNWMSIDAQTGFSDTYCRYTTIPDAAFEAELENLGLDDISNDGQVPTALIENVTALTLFETGTADLTGIQDFTALEQFNLNDETITTVNLSGNTNLKDIEFTESVINNLILDNNPLLETIEFENGDELSSITDLDLSNSPLLQRIDINDVGLVNINLPETLPNLEILFLSGNNFTTFDASSYVALRRVSFRNNAALTGLNLKNGANTNILSANFDNSPNLTCISVDDAAYSTANWTNIDAQTSFTEGYCLYTQIPDVNFEAALDALGYDDVTADGQVPTALIETVAVLDLTGKGIQNMSGIEAFTALIDLNLKENSISSIDLSENKLLEIVNFEECESLVDVDISDNEVLRILDFNQAGITNIDLSNAPALEVINANSSAISALDVSVCTNLKEINVSSTPIATLNVKNGNNTAITSFNAVGTENLDCVLVDNAAYSTANWTNIDAQTSFNETSCDTVNLSLAINVILQGAALNTDAGEEEYMRDDLRAAGLLPTTSPYADGLTCDASVFNATGEIGDDIVDWVWVELRDATDPTVVVASRSALVQRDSDVVAIDGTSNVNFTTNSNTYYVVIKHRNHLGVMTSEPFNLTSVHADLDFTQDITSAQGENLALAALSNGQFAMYAGDANADGNILNTDITGALSGSGSINTYSGADANMDGNILNTDIQLIIQPNAGRIQQFN